MADTCTLGENPAHPCTITSPRPCRLPDYLHNHYKNGYTAFYHKLCIQMEIEDIKYEVKVHFLIFCNHNVYRNNITRHANATRLHVRPNTIPAGGRTRKITRESKTQNKRDVKKYFHLVSLLEGKEAHFTKANIVRNIFFKRFSPSDISGAKLMKMWN